MANRRPKDSRKSFNTFKISEEKEDEDDDFFYEEESNPDKSINANSLNNTPLKDINQTDRKKSRFYNGDQGPKHMLNYSLDRPRLPLEIISSKHKHTRIQIQEKKEIIKELIMKQYEEHDKFNVFYDSSRHIPKSLNPTSSIVSINSPINDKIVNEHPLNVSLPMIIEHKTNLVTQKPKETQMNKNLNMRVERAKRKFRPSNVRILRNLKKRVFSQ